MPCCAMYLVFKSLSLTPLSDSAFEVYSPTNRRYWYPHGHSKYLNRRNKRKKKKRKKRNKKKERGRRRQRKRKDEKL